MKRLPLLAGLAILLLLAAVLAGTFSGGSFAAHMIVHMGIVAVAAPFIAYGTMGTRIDPVARLPWMTPMLASIVELVVVWFWHVPALRLFASQSLGLTIVEQASFLAAGLLLWATCLSPGKSGEGRLAGAAGLLFTSMHMTLLGVLLALSPRPLYGEGTVTCFGLVLPAAIDQQAGGVVMLMVGACAYLCGGVVLLSGVLRAEGAANREERRC
jgi:putative membrane protein